MPARCIRALVTVALLVCTAQTQADPMGAGGGDAGIFGENHGSPVDALGTYAYAFEFALVRPRGAVGTSLGLTYRSSSVDGEAGFGWSLRTQSIQRAPLSGWPAYEDDNDRFVANGRVLSRVCVVGGGAQSCGPDPMPPWARGWRHFREKHDETFARYFLSPDGATWRLQARGGTITEFGRAIFASQLSADEEATERDEKESSRPIFRWLPTREFDDHGGLVVYNWTRDAGGSGRRVLSDIWDTPPVGQPLALRDFANHVSLEWLAAFAWSSPRYARVDKARLASRLNRVIVTAMPWEDSRQRDVLRVYHLEYLDQRSAPYDPQAQAPLYRRSFLKSIQTEGRCGVQEGPQGQAPTNFVCPRLPPVTFDYEPGPINGDIASIARTQPASAGAQPAFPDVSYEYLDGSDVKQRVGDTLGSRTLVDVNGDGLPDIVQFWPTEKRIGDYVHYNPRALFGYINLGRMVGYLELKRVCMDPGATGTGGTVSFANPVTGPSTFLSNRQGATVLGRWGDSQALWSTTDFGPVRTQRVKAGAEFCDTATQDPDQEAWAWLTSSRVPWVVATSLSGQSNASGRWFTDIDGDGYPDYLERVQGNPAVGLELGKAVFTRQYGLGDKHAPGNAAALVPFDFRFQASQRANSLVPAETASSSDNRYVYVDMNGDGLVDLVTFVRGSTSEYGSIGISVRPGDGRGHFECKEEADNTPISFPLYRHCEKTMVSSVPAGTGSSGSPWLTSAYVLKLIDTPDADVDAGDDPFNRHEWRLRDGEEWYMHDVTGDGLADFIVLSVSDGRLVARLWVNEDGKNFRCVDAATRCLMSVFSDEGRYRLVQGEPHRVLFADMDGRGRDGLVLLTSRGVFFATAVAGALATVPRPGLLTQVDNGLGAITSIEYATTPQLAAEAASQGRPWQTNAPVPLTVVRRVATRASAGPAAPTTASVPEPFEIARSVEYEYRDPAWDPWLRRIAGFRKVRAWQGSGQAATETTRWFGPCQQPRAAAPCAGTPDANTEEGRSGRIIRLDRANLVASPARWLSSTLFYYQTNPISQTNPNRPGSDGGASYTYPYKVEVHRYEPDVATQQGTIASTSGDSIENSPRQAGAVVSTTIQEMDVRGNVLRTDSLGRGPAQEKGIRTATKFTCDAEWRCLADETSTSWIVNSPSDPQYERKFSFTYKSGLLESVLGYLDRSPPPVRVHEDPAALVAPNPAGLVSPGWLTLERYRRDALGNIVTVERPGQVDSCSEVEYERVYSRYPSRTKAYQSGACQGGFLSRSTRYDTGFQTVVERSVDNGSHTVATLDAFGRLSGLSEPTGNGLYGALASSLTVQYHDASPASWKRIREVVNGKATHDRVAIFNGLSERVLEYEQAYTSQGDPQDWRGLAWIERGDSAGRVTRMLGPWSQGADPLQSIGSLSAVAPSSAALAVGFVYDTFGRPTETFRYADPSNRFIYHANSVEVFDAAQLASSRDRPLFGIVYSEDGHGRPDGIVQRVENDEHRTRIDRLPTGEPYRYAYSHPAGAASVVHDLQLDSLGRLIQSFEPNSTVGTGAGRRGRQFAWDASGHLVGESDARGCGRNYFYDALGRVVSEDYSPCTREQAPYSAPSCAQIAGSLRCDPQSAGFEASYRYDTYDPGDRPPEHYVDDPRNARGRLTALRDRGASTRLSYDSRGRMRRVARNLAVPVTPAGLAYWRFGFAQLRDYDLGNRLTRQTTGVRSATTGDEGFVAYTYSPRGALISIDSSEGLLVKDVTYRDDALASSLTYGDLAGTSAAYKYDANRRLAGYRYERAAPPLWATSSATYPTPSAETTIAKLADVSITRDMVGNPTLIVDAYSSSWPTAYVPLPVSYTYDALYQVRHLVNGPQVTWTPPFEHEHRNGNRAPQPPEITPWRPKETRIAYDWLGNTTSVVDDAKVTYDRTIDAIGNGDGAGQGPHQLQTASGIRARYDAAGNLVELNVERAGRCISNMCAQRFVYSWDEVGSLVRARRWDFIGNAIPAGTPAWPSVPSVLPARDLSFKYSNGERVLRRTTDELGGEQYDLNVLNDVVFPGARANATGTGYVFTPSEPHIRLADFARVVPGAGLPSPSGATSRTFLDLKDGLGSSTITIDRATSEVVERTSYLPYGGVENHFQPPRWIGSSKLPPSAKFTGKALDIEVGVINFGARYLHAHLGRWMSPDPLVAVKATEESNPYAYVSGRVAAAVDPDGLQETVDGVLWMPAVEIKGPPRESVTTIPALEISSRVPYETDVSDRRVLAEKNGYGHWDLGDVSNLLRGIGNAGIAAINAAANDILTKGGGLAPSYGDIIPPIPVRPGHERATWFGNVLGQGLLIAGPIYGRLLGEAEAVSAVAESPSVDTLSRAGQVMDLKDKAGLLTKAGRSLQKHQAGVRRGATRFPAVKGPPANWNTAGQHQLDDILTTPGAVTTPLGRGGWKVSTPDGRGVRFDANGSFSGFVE